MKNDANNFLSRYIMQKRTDICSIIENFFKKRRPFSAFQVTIIGNEQQRTASKWRSQKDSHPYFRVLVYIVRTESPQQVGPKNTQRQRTQHDGVPTVIYRKSTTKTDQLFGRQQLENGFLSKTRRNNRSIQLHC